MGGNSRVLLLSFPLPLSFYRGGSFEPPLGFHVGACGLIEGNGDRRPVKQLGPVCRVEHSRHRVLEKTPPMCFVKSVNCCDELGVEGCWET